MLKGAAYIRRSVFVAWAQAPAKKDIEREREREKIARNGGDREEKEKREAQEGRT